MRVRYTSRARGDLRDILRFINAQSPRGAQKIEQAIRSTIRLIGEFPKSGRNVGDYPAQMLSTGRYPYLVYWTIENNEAWLIHIRHARRKPWQYEMNISDSR